MPLGYTRLNERAQRPNTNINFIKPLPNATTSDQEIARDFLERIAAQCYPIMKEHYISVMALEEYPPNPEFLGRNFNAGEVIQLVLKDKSGRWLGFQFVQMVMMHELAHCKQMNHSRFFWKERNLYADQMKDLWKKGYLGEGLWGRGKDLTSGRFIRNAMPEDADIPEHLCGGTYRRARGRKRKRGADANTASSSSTTTTSTYAERQQKRISRKFGKHGGGNALGEDDLVRGGLEASHRHQGKPKVAQSKRGRELRAAAALARLEHAKKQQQIDDSRQEEQDSETETDWSDGDEHGDSSRDGQTEVVIRDGHGRDLVRVCGDADDTEQGAVDEMQELQAMQSHHPDSTPADSPKPSSADDSGLLPSPNNQSDTRDDLAREPRSHIPPEPERPLDIITANTTAATDPNTSIPKSDLIPATTCTVCSLENDRHAPTCIACANVLKPSLVKDVWRCQSETCRGTAYLNAGDAGRCGLCASVRPPSESTKTSMSSSSSSLTSSLNGRATATRSARGGGNGRGVVSSDILRWD